MGSQRKTDQKITYPNCKSARKPVPHDETNPPPVPPADMTDTSSSGESTSDTETGEGDMYVLDADNSPHLLGQAELNDLVCNLELTKEQAELLGSRLQERNFIKPGTKISHFRSHHMKFLFDSLEENVCFCK